jgi:hypothetical protein
MILVIMLCLHQEVTFLTFNTPLLTAIFNDLKRVQYFSDYLGALDRTCIDVHLLIAEQGR